MKVGEIKGFMYENASLVDTRTSVVHYSSAGHTSVMTGGVRIGSCAEEGDGEDGVAGEDGEDAWRPDAPIPEQPMLTP